MSESKYATKRGREGISKEQKYTELFTSYLICLFVFSNSGAVSSDAMASCVPSISDFLSIWQLNAIE